MMLPRPARPDDLPSILALLGGVDLLGDGVAQHLADFLVIDADEEIVAVAGLEVYGPCALLRSVAVRKDLQKRGSGRGLVEHALQHAAARGVREVYLLTTTAAPFFARLGFAVARREEAPAAIAASREFSQLCPKSAEFMRRDLVARSQSPQDEVGT